MKTLEHERYAVIKGQKITLSEILRDLSYIVFPCYPYDQNHKDLLQRLLLQPETQVYVHYV